MWIRLVALVVEELLMPVGVAVIIVLGVADLVVRDVSLAARVLGAHPRRHLLTVRAFLVPVAGVVAFGALRVGLLLVVRLVAALGRRELIILVLAAGAFLRVLVLRVLGRPLPTKGHTLTSRNGSGL